MENDVLGGTDRYYTNGLKIGFGEVAFVNRVMRAAGSAVLDPDPKDCKPIQVGVFLGQNIYTPRRISVREEQPNDRPWAAWLYVGAVAQTADKNRLDTLEIDVGMVGPTARGEQVQSQWHELIGSPRPNGWRFQIPDEPGFLVSYLHKRKFGSESVDFIPHAGLTLGTVSTLARVGGIVRVGSNMTGFGPDTIEPGGAMLQSTRAQLAEAPANWEWFAFAGADVRLVAYNIFLDGTVFHDSPRVDRRPGVYDFLAGLSLRYKRLRVSLTHVRRSGEFTTPVGGDSSHKFDSLNIGFEW